MSPWRFTIRPIDPDDWASVDLVQRDAFLPEAVEGIEAIRCLQELSPRTCFVAMSGPQLIGYFIAHPWIAEDLPPLNTILPALPQNAQTLFIHDLALLRAFRGRGVAPALVTEGLKAGASLGLKDAGLLSIQDSRRFWEKMGFQPRVELREKIRPILERFIKVDFVFMTRPDLEQ